MYAAVVIHYRQPKLLESALRALWAQTLRPSEIVVVDNGRTLRPEHLPAEIQPPPRIYYADNPGYGAAVNIGRGAISHASDYMLVVTHDVLMDGNCVPAMLELIRSSEDVGAVGPVLERASQPGTIYSGGGRVKFGGRVAHMTDIPTASRVVPWVDGAIMLHKLAAFDGVRGFKEQYFLYFEEVDYCHRLADSGASTVICAEARAAQEPGNFTPYLKFRNQILFSGTRFGRLQTGIAVSYQYVRSVVGCLLRRDFLGPVWAGLGIRDGISGRGGPPPQDLREAIFHDWRRNG